jgi:hypothetical protein
MRTAICKIEYDGWGEEGIAKITSPSRRSIRVRARFNDTVSDELKDVFVNWDHYYHIGFYGKGKQKFKQELSYSNMRELLMICL